VHGIAIDKDIALIGIIKATHNLQQGRLTRA
jgi:hypothetical protein